jgi:endo-1,4-beta-xylanase
LVAAIRRRGGGGGVFAAASVILLAVAVGLVLVNGAGSDPESAEATPTPAVAESPPSTPTLRGLAAARGLRFGSAVDVSALSSDAAYATVLAQEFSSVTAENAMKWATVQPSPGERDWSGADRLVEFARRYGQQVYGHTLVWHSSDPAWLASVVDGPGSAAKTLRAHIEEQVSRYRGDVWAWDVVNEVIGPDHRLRDTIWHRYLGSGYIADAFRWAHAADPDALLFINDYGAENSNPKSDALYALVKQLLADGVPIHGVGFQTHLSIESNIASFQANLQRFADLGLKVAITEMGVRLPLPVTAEKLAAQARVYGAAVQACLAVPQCISISVWGFSDKYSWLAPEHEGDGSACLLDPMFRPKPAYHAVLEALAQTR